MSSSSYVDQRETIMKEIVEAKAAQVPAFKDVLQKLQRNALFNETTHDELWKPTQPNSPDWTNLVKSLV